MLKREIMKNTAKSKKIECKLCRHSILNESNELHCILGMINKNIYLESSKVSTKSDCVWFKEKSK